MEHFNKEFCLEIAGDYACFTRPEFKVERVSYDVITPSAMRAIFESIFWKPAIKWIPTKIEVLSPFGKHVSVRRNEVGVCASTRTKEVFIEDARQQKASQLLKDVHYRIYAELEFIPVDQRPVYQRPPEGTTDENPGKYYGIFERRARKGQTFNHPYLGCREFSCSTIRLVDNPEIEERPVAESCDFGYMLFDMDFSDEENISPMFFKANMDCGVIQIPRKDSEEVMQ